MDTVCIRDISRYEGSEVAVRGWLYNKRSSGKIHFFIIRDGTGIIQGVMSRGEVDEGVFSLYEGLTIESSLRITGRVRADRRAPGGYELTLTGMEVIQVAADDYPLSLKEHGTAFLMDNRHLWIRTPRQNAILRIRGEIVKACRDFLDERGFVLLDSPIFTPAACEGTTTLFETDYFYDRKAYLSQSGQLYQEAGAAALGKVYCFGPTFRAEKSKTRRHLTEFWMVEPEVAYADIDDIMELAEEMVAFILERVLQRRTEELKAIEREREPLESIKTPFPRITYAEAVDILKEKGFDIREGEDFGGDEETAISESFDRPVIIHRYPASIKPFYMKGDPEDESLVLNMDILAPQGFGEIIGGSQREDDLERLLLKMERQNVPREGLGWYIDLRRYGSFPHSGFGLGVERVVAWICGLTHIRETIPFPRTMTRLYP